jgi:predicted nucleic acid-binding protein
VLICDTSCLLAYFDESDAFSARVSAVIEADSGPFVISPYIVAELNHLLATRRGTPAEIAVLEELSSGAWDLAEFGRAEVRQALAVIDRYSDQDLGLADASLVVLAARYRTDHLLTLDRRHFGVVRAIDGTRFTLVPTQ